MEVRGNSGWIRARGICNWNRLVKALGSWSLVVLQVLSSNVRDTDTRHLLAASWLLLTNKSYYPGIVGGLLLTRSRPPTIGVENYRYHAVAGGDFAKQLQFEFIKDIAW